MPRRDRRRSALIGAAALALVAIAFSPTFQNDFINFDDKRYLTENPHLDEGFLQTLRWAFTTFTAANWHPVTWLSHRLDVALFGLDPRGHHAVGLLIHAVNTLLAFRLLQRLLGAVWPAALVAVLFGVHPLHVESVAWAAERKDLLSTFFLLLMLAAYRRYVGGRSVARYAAVALCLALGLMCKPMLVTAPLLLLCLDYWPLGRLAPRDLPGRAAGSGRGRLRVLAEKAPLLALSLLSAAITWVAQSRGGAARTLEEYPLPIRAGNALVSAATYVLKTAWPKDLAILYPHPGPGLSALEALLAAGFLATITLSAVRCRRRLPHLIAGWLWYLASLSPVLGLVQVGSQAMADRYTYVPLTGLFLALGWWAGALRSSLPLRQGAVGAAGLAIVLSFAAMTNLQVRAWRSSEAVFGHALEVTENNFVAHDNLSSALLDAGRTREAMRHALAALRIHPDKEPGRYLRFAGALLQQGMNEEAVEVLEEAVRMSPADPVARHLLELARAAASREGPGPR